MTKAIKSYPESERQAVIIRRLKNDGWGLGTISAKEAALKLGIKVPKKEKRGE